MATIESQQQVNEYTIHVGNISYKTTWRELSEFFTTFGKVKHCYIAKDRRKGWSKGFGFVSFYNAESIEKIFNSSDEDLVLEDRLLRVSHAQSKKQRRIIADENNATVGNEVEVLQVKESQEELTKNLKYENSTVLSDDALFLVFSFLELKDLITVERVCKRWYELMRRFWHSKKLLHFRNIFTPFKGQCRGLTDKTLLSILKRTCGELQYLDLSASAYQLSDFALDIIGTYCPKLIDLDLTRATLAQTSVKLLSSKLSCLKRLTLKTCGLSEKCLWWFLHNSSRLEYLNIQGNRQITGKCFYIARGKLIKTIIMNDCINFTDEGLQLLSQGNPNLEVLEINHCDSISCKAVTSLAKKCCKLRELQFMTSIRKEHVPDMTAFHILQNLEVLVLNHRVEMKDAALVAIGQRCHKLRKLSLEGCYDISDEGLIGLCDSQLHDLNINYCRKITDRGIIRVTLNGILRRLQARACPELTLLGVTALVEHCPGLRELDLSGCLGIGNKLLPELQRILLDDENCHRKSSEFTLNIGGTLITTEATEKFVECTNANVSLQDFSISSLCVDYDPYMNINPLDVDDWESDHEPCIMLPGLAHEAHQGAIDIVEEEHFVKDFLLERAEDWLIGEDPAMFSDEFSDPEEWGIR